MRVIAGISSSDAKTAGLKEAVQRIALDPKIVSSHWWTSEIDD